MTRLSALTALTALVAAGCSTSYLPRSPGRVFVTMDGGVPAYVRDGRSYRHGFLGSGLREAVSGNRQAERAADEYHDRIRDGLLIALVGGVCTGTALGMAISDLEPNGGSNRGADTKLLVALGCTGLMMGGALYTATAEPYRWDAINIFNDNPPPMPGMWPGAQPGIPGPPGYGPDGASATAPVKKRLGMRSE